MGHSQTGIARSILHVDDDRAFTSIVAARLKPLGYDVAELHDPTRAIAAIAEGAYRVVLLDMAMPGLHGIQLLREIKAVDGAVQVIVLTGLVNMTTVLQTMRAGAEACVFKPLTDLDPLTEALDASFAKLDRWWRTLNELSVRRKREQAIVQQSCQS